MLFLIDGYNLLHAMGLVAKHAGPDGLEWARRRLLSFLRNAFPDDATSVTVVFDAAKSPKGFVAEHDYEGIHVLFAVHHDEADDLIELLIRKSTAPKDLTVVSDDHRIQRAARRRQCAVSGCAEFLDWLMEHRRLRPQRPGEATKPDVLSENEKEHWLREFGDLANDPNIKEVFDPFDFE